MGSGAAAGAGGEALMGQAPPGTWHRHALRGQCLGCAAGCWAQVGQVRGQSDWPHSPRPSGGPRGPGGGLKMGSQVDLWAFPWKGPLGGPHRHCSYLKVATWAGPWRPIVMMMTVIIIIMLMTMMLRMILEEYSRSHNQSYRNLAVFLAAYCRKPRGFLEDSYICWRIP